LAQLCADGDIEVLDAPVSGGRPAARARRLATLVGGPATAATRCEAVFRSFSAHVIHLGPAGTGQLAKLFNNALLMMNQAGIADTVALARQAGLDPVTLVEALGHCSATSAALTLLNTMVTPETVDHLSQVEALDMELFDSAIRDAGVDAAEITARGLSGAHRLPGLIRALTDS
jgi:3-hydroxyisobutyrate dehydrogenase-like beta-hydroxyacid dehydrogenase